MSTIRAAKKKLKVEIDPFIRSDLDEVLQIEEEIFQFPFRWNKEHFLTTMRESPCRGYVARFGGSIVGFVIYEKKDDGYGLLSLAVSKMYQRLGIASQMIEYVIKMLTSEEFRYISLLASEYNEPAHYFFQKMNFKGLRVFRSWYENGDDAYEMRFRV